MQDGGRPNGDGGGGANQEEDPESNRNHPPIIRPAYPTTLEAMTRNADHPLRMKLTWEEIQWAQEIKDAIEAEPGLDNLSDFMYAQMALSFDQEDGTDNDQEDGTDNDQENGTDNDQDDTDHALQVAVSKAQALQDFRKKYGIVESYQDGCRALRRLARLYPGFFLSFGFDPDQGTYVCAADMAQFDSSVYTNDGLNAFFVGYYYFSHSKCPDLQTIHKGIIGMLECKGMGWNRKKELKVWRKLANELFSVYPHAWIAQHYNTGAIINVLGNTVKQLLPKEAAAKFEFGLHFEDGLDSIYLVPNVETATQRLLTRIEAALRMRFDNESRFSLDNTWDIRPQTDDEFEVLCGARGI